MRIKLPQPSAHSTVPHQQQQQQCHIEQWLVATLRQRLLLLLLRLPLLVPRYLLTSNSATINQCNVLQRQRQHFVAQMCKWTWWACASETAWEGDGTRLRATSGRMTNTNFLARLPNRNLLAICAHFFNFFFRPAFIYVFFLRLRISFVVVGFLCFILFAFNWP